MHFFTFLGTGAYKECRYHYHHRGADFTSPPVSFVQTAAVLMHKSSVTRISVFTTPVAEKANA
ncbi:MAG: TM1812 family CRISPR-associated protein, partial [Bradymonadaceae bacterium]